MSSTARKATRAISRDPGEYRLSIHAGQQHKHRGIEKQDIARAIRAGEVRQTREPEVKLFVVDVPGEDDRVGVTADVATGEIITVTWRAQ